MLHRILDKVAEEVQKRGLVGEERLAQTLYLVLTSRLRLALISLSGCTMPLMQLTK